MRFYPRRLRRFPMRLPLSLRTIYRVLGMMLLPLLGWLLLWALENKAEPKAPATGLPVELYANQNNDNLTLTFTNAIDRAQDSVLLMVYSITDPSIIKALRTKAESGIPVRVIVDAKTSPSVEERLGPKVSLLKRFGDGLMHMKILLIDNKEIYLGSANMTSESLKMHGNLVTGIESPEMAAIIEKKAGVLKYDGTGTIVGEYDFNIGGQQVELWFLPDRYGAVHRIQKLINSAKKSVRIAMFTWTRRDLATSVIEAKRRGVDVQVVIDYNSGRGAGAEIVEMLKKAGVVVHLSRSGPLLHHKFLYIDSSVLINGSANWTRAAFRQNNDCFIVVKDLTQQQVEQMDALWTKIFNDSLPAR